ncbi:hypothetical protein LEP1GSC202_0637 [Leptospira yanagawae serovar Saopaulo str. Sao Paulo = ATCC 700523]|uniref:Uncharacterized protein n=1 Tax=Leptospira yanagawae serovar Saopaulo str. Sao Paulo = ATCC 700523 TaxID=1249483 RepID=A0A5E8HK72_9LEPT|nr:hypothetical protein LEP1GSC202_0637 [Leptospira yanagawae serovar Saopaulo str. Sao Paulo = ATCC 700523]
MERKSNSFRKELANPSLNRRTDDIRYLEFVCVRYSYGL